MKIPKKRDNDYDADAIKKRIRFLSKVSGQPIRFLPDSTIDPELTRGNIESLIGFAKVPVGVIGPLNVQGDHAHGNFYVPMSTTEGALISSYNRGARAITLSGGVRVSVTRDSIQRAPYFVLENLQEANEFVRFLADHFQHIKAAAERTTAFGKLLDYRTFMQGRIVYVRLNFSTGDAMGMNMITKASQEACRYIVSKFPVQGFAIESNMAVDKKPSHINTLMGRGKTVTAEVLFKERVISRFMHTTARKIDLAYRRQVTGAQLAGVLGSNGHVANGVAAIFLACGQDMANVSESCVGYIYTETIGKDLYVSLQIPSLVIGTIGGGVSLPTQRECLEILGCYGKDKAVKFAEIIAATVMAGEISLAAAIVAGDFVTAHEKFGRNKPG
ncbi:MAG: hydroxymethylglutaryl-CoA reductase [Bacteroidales bacterium]|nr:hydroxymethylglutaryl-CoA reductase [Bacteroidales bacterium]